MDKRPRTPGGPAGPRVQAAQFLEIVDPDVVTGQGVTVAAGVQYSAAAAWMRHAFHR